MKTHAFADIDIRFFVEAGAPRDAFDDEGILDVDRLIALGWEIDENAESFDPPRS
ncbi:hypothetical protein [Ilumatobacter nonamiensis]|uniref:hypothetical protein n=1 Tax=Ilumatobacter nonamiensis TaxID=467093 RepID=UPI0003487A06|nr:hypothetical protein [Ilumatobacter nonamiensis]